MGGLKTFCLGFVLATLATGTRAEEALLRHVSECVGRYSAQMEHHWLFQDTASDQIERARSHLVDILDTLTTPETATQVLARRIDAKMAHATLLSQAAFSTDPKLAAWADRRARHNLRLCSDIALIAPVPALARATASSDRPIRGMHQAGSRRP